eukprot:c16384_g1_i2 orf=324-659(+)
MSKTSNALNIRGRPQSRNISQRNKSRSKSRPQRSIECFHCGKKGHIKKDCYKFKKELRKEQGEKKKTKEGGEEVNTVAKDDDILFASMLLSSDAENLSTWIIDSGASFHVT